MIPGGREQRLLTRFQRPYDAVVNGGSTVDAATILERQKEGGGGASQRPSPGSR
jgi:hypothetical protein